MAGLGPVPNPTWPGLWVRTAGLTFYLFSKSPSPILLNKYPCPQYKAQAQPEPDPEWEKLYQITTKILNTNKIYQMAVIYLFQIAIKCPNILHSKALQNLPKLGLSVSKYSIWQPWFQAAGPYAPVWALWSPVFCSCRRPNTWRWFCRGRGGSATASPGGSHHGPFAWPREPPCPDRGWNLNRGQCYGLWSQLFGKFSSKNGAFLENQCFCNIFFCLDGCNACNLSKNRQFFLHFFRWKYF
jgi:hypothetical protein